MKLKEFLKEQKTWTLAEFADELGLSVSRLYMMINLEVEPKLSTAKKVYDLSMGCVHPFDMLKDQEKIKE